jgi:hypothetical protein
MKNTLLILILFSLVACKKHDVKPKTDTTICTKKNFIVAGAKGDCFIYKSLNLTLLPKWGSYNNIFVDINGDESNDICFGIIDFSYNLYFEFLVINKSIDISAYHFTSAINDVDSNSLNINYDVKGFNLNDTIKNNSEWTTKKDTIYKTGITKHRKYDNHIFSLKNPYIGFRFINNNDTLYGWMHVAITDTTIIVYDYAYQKR